jgi:hypothetical protein
MKLLKSIFKKERKQPKIHGKVVLCHDCGQIGYVVWDIGSDVTMPQGWKIVWVGFKPIFICGDCQDERRKWAQQFLCKE